MTVIPLCDEAPLAAAAAHTNGAGIEQRAEGNGTDGDSSEASFRERSLREIDLCSALAERFPSSHLQLGASPSLLPSLTSLDLSHNELSDVPGLAALPNLTSLDLSRNWLRALPSECGRLPALRSLSAARNFLRPTAEALLLGDPGLAALPDLASLDLRYNRKCDRQQLLDLLAKELPRVTARITVSFPAPEGAFVGANPCDRDPLLLRSQLEPWPTLVLRRRLEQDFRQPPTNADEVDRAEVMRRLLAAYASQGLVEGGSGEDGGGGRRVVRAEGVRVPEDLCSSLLTELRSWALRSERNRRNRQERPSIKASSYMILRSPEEFRAKKQEGSRKAAAAARKLEENRRLWDLAADAIGATDPDFASKYTALAVTHGFTGSPHIDKQNVGPFYGLALGDFDEGQGGICVEVDARTVAHVNTKGRLGKVDGRFPHWVAPYDASKHRFSLIYYQTEGEPTPLGPAVLSNWEPEVGAEDEA